MGKIYRHRTARSDELMGYMDEETGHVYDSRLSKDIVIGKVELDNGKVYFTRYGLDEYVGSVNLEDGKVRRHKTGPDKYIGRVNEEGKLYRHRSLEKDDYEGYFLPMQRLDGNTGVLAALNATAPIEVNDPMIDIWGVNNSSSMVMKTHTATTFHGTLQYPVADYEVVSILGVDLGVVPNDPVTPAAILPIGEMAEMFPCEDVDGNRDTNVNFCLHWQDEPLDVLAHWTINEVGDYMHQFTPSSSINPDSWWPVDGEIYDVGNIPGIIARGAGKFQVTQPTFICVLYFLLRL